MTPENKRDEAIVLGALPSARGQLVEVMRSARRSAGQTADYCWQDTDNAIGRLKRAGKIRYNRSAKVWEKTECSG